MENNEVEEALQEAQQKENTMSWLKNGVEQ